MRQKLAHLYGKEPLVKDELKEVIHRKEEHSTLSKHQKFMDELSKSGRSLAEIQKAWHDYYQKLPDKEKHEVWQEFYKKHSRGRRAHQPQTVAERQIRTQPRTRRQRRPSKKDEILRHVAAQARGKKSHAHSALFGVSVGLIFLFIVLFSFFNERFITPFIRPNSNVGATSIIVDPSQATNVGPESKIIIPKINIEAPVVYDEPSVEEKAVQKALERGVVHYSITPSPGELGNGVIVGHSSSNILNSGKYKFAFLLLKSLEPGDTFYVQKDGVRYVYKVFNKFVTSPTDTLVLNPTDRPSTMTLITCDPPGLSTNRLIIQGEQIFPDPANNKQSSVDVSNEPKPEELGGNAPSLWQRIRDAF